jgi:hypothetical protein
VLLSLGGKGALLFLQGGKEAGAADQEEVAALLFVRAMQRGLLSTML